MSWWSLAHTFCTIKEFLSETCFYWKVDILDFDMDTNYTQLEFGFEMSMMWPVELDRQRFHLSLAHCSLKQNC